MARSNSGAGMELCAQQAGQTTSLSARIAAMLEYHSCSQSLHLHGQRPSSSNMDCLRVRALRETLLASPRSGFEAQVGAFHKESKDYLDLAAVGCTMCYVQRK